MSPGIREDVETDSWLENGRWLSQRQSFGKVRWCLPSDGP